MQYIEWCVDPLTDKRKRVTIALTPTGRKSDDRIAADALRAKIRDVCENAGETNSLTLKALKNKYIAYQRGHVKQQTAENDERKRDRERLLQVKIL